MVWNYIFEHCHPNLVINTSHSFCLIYRTTWLISNVSILCTKICPYFQNYQLCRTFLVSLLECYPVLSLSHLCLRVENKILNEIHWFMITPKLFFPRGRGCHESYNFLSTYHKNTTYMNQICFINFTLALVLQNQNTITQ